MPFSVWSVCIVKSFLKHITGLFNSSTVIKLKNPAKEAVHKKIHKSVKEIIDQKTSDIVNEINKRTIVYALWSLAGILLIAINLPKILFYILSSVMIVFVIYFMMEALRPLKKTIAFIDNFDQEIERFIKQKIQTNIGDSLHNQIGLKLSGQSSKDIENICISYFIRELARRFKKHKRDILTRVAAYTVAVLLFKEVLFNILT